MNQVKEILPFVLLADNIEPSNKMFAYYLRKYATDRIYQSSKGQNNNVAQEIYPQLNAMIKKTEELTRHLDGQLHINQNLTDILAYTDRIFMQAQEQYKYQRLTPELSQNYQTAWRFYEMVNYFNQMTADQNKKRTDAKAKAVQVFKRLKETGSQQTLNNPSHFQTPPPTFQPQTQFPMYSQFHQPQNTFNNQTNGHQFGKKKRIDPQKIKAQTTAINQLQNAVSQLQFNRVHYAKDSIKKALSLLQKFHD